MNDRMNLKRVVSLIIIFLVTCGYTAGICLYRRLWLDEIVLLSVLSLIFFALFVFSLEYNRSHRTLSGNSKSDFGKAAAGYTISALVMTAGMFLPEFIRPALIAAVCMVALSNVEIALCTNLFFCTIFCLGFQTSSYELVLYCLLTLFGCMVAKAMEDIKYTFWYHIMLICISLLLPGIFYYLNYQKVFLNLYLYGAIEGIILDYLMLTVQKRVSAYRSKELERKYRRLMEETYSLRVALGNFSKAEYEHALRVSTLASRCAAVIGADERLCAVAGFYYRIGVIEGDAIAESGQQIAERECFPEDICRVISEYNGDLELPSTPESAIVHMVDGLVKKMEVLQNRKDLESQWNQDMVIYQTLNEFSATGIYDLSGLSMNRFLQIREYLVKEEKII